MTTLALYLLLTFGASLVLTPLCRLAAHRLGYVSRPKEDRWHKRPTAMFGGLAIVATTIGAAGTIHGLGAAAALIWAAALIAAVGFVDDVLTLKPSTKLIAQISVASLLLFFGFRLQWTESMVGDAMLTVFWIVGVTNAFNLLDNMDGLCAGTALIASAFMLAAVVTATGVTPVALYLAALIGATAGFFVYNAHPASIFMGDTGSLFLGLNLAAVSLVGNAPTRSSGLLPVIAAPVLPLLLPIFDTALVTAARLLAGRRPSQGGRDHTSHRLVAIGLSERLAVLTLWTLAAAGGVISILMQRRDAGLGIVTGVMFLIAMVIFAVYLARVRVYDDADFAMLKGGESMTPLVANFMYKRRVAEVLLDLLLIPLAYYSAYRLRFEGVQLGANYPLFIESLPVVLASQLLALFVVGGYRGTWRYFGMMDAVVFGKGVVLGTAAAELLILYVYRFQNYSRTVFVIDAVLLFLLLAGTRASFRLVGEFILRRRASGQRCIIYGTNGASVGTIREAFGTSALKIVGFIDDDPMHRHIRVGGYMVVGTFPDLIALVNRGELDCVVLNTPLLDVERLQELEACCRELDVQILRLQVQLKRISAAS